MTVSTIEFNGFLIQTIGENVVAASNAFLETGYAAKGQKFTLNTFVILMKWLKSFQIIFCRTFTTILFPVIIEHVGYR
jgi:hypothetical protein